MSIISSLLRKLSIIKMVLTRRVRTPKEIKERNREIAISTCSRYSRGNISLQNGLISFSSDIERMKEENFKLKF